MEDKYDWDLVTHVRGVNVASRASDQPHQIILSRICWQPGRGHSITLWSECLDQGESS